MNTRVCHRCGSATVDFPPAEITIATGEAWAVNTRRITLCRDCSWLFLDWLSMPHIESQLGAVHTEHEASTVYRPA